MILIAILLLVMAGWKVLTIFLLPFTNGMETTVVVTPGRIAFRSFTAMLTAVILILAAILLLTA